MFVTLKYIHKHWLSELMTHPFTHYNRIQSFVMSLSIKVDAEILSLKKPKCDY